MLCYLDFAAAAGQNTRLLTDVLLCAGPTYLPTYSELLGLPQHLHLQRQAGIIQGVALPK